MSAARGRVLAVDDDPDLLRLLALRLKAAGFEVITADSGERALALLAASRVQVLITDLRMGGMDGMALFEAVQRQQPSLPVIMLTAHGSIPDAVAATQRGVFGYLEKPVDAARLLATVEHAAALNAPPATAQDEAWRADILTCSNRMEEVLAKAKLVADVDAPVLIVGASGSGKEMLARAIHRAGRRARSPFVAINCGAIPENLLESELFGYTKGAFTGAARDHTGLIIAANGGTLFLDEIGDMPLPLQVKLLRVLQERELRPLGATETRSFDVRVISATHRDLDARMAEGLFREDLYYRLKVVTLELPALEARREDIPLLARQFLNKLATQYGKDMRGFAPEALELLAHAAWPGNVRQLYNVVEQAVALSTAPIVPPALVEQAIRKTESAIASFEDARNSFEREYLAQLLKLTGGNVSQAARLAKRNRTEFYKLLGRHKLEPAQFKPGDED
ncbi:MAG: sigma 54-interacting transcriptional regulator [Rhodocyclaceae bacterium]|nr:sigma 54-interacting transcriptional regulator [Rhodocyclaceae bacterium]MBX3669059.1 sigma 54-interacting transcriptional regulator [Rhodocyclaceae bacterium]